MRCSNHKCLPSAARQRFRKRQQKYVPWPAEVSLPALRSSKSQQYIGFSKIPAEYNTQGGQQCTGDITITIPGGCSGPWPVLVFIAGYGVPASYYAGIATGLAQSGFAVVQYDRSDPPPANHVELAFFDELLAWLTSWNATEGLSQLQDSISVAGHSMGGGLAAEAAGRHADSIKALVLLDPVSYPYNDASISPVSYLTAWAKPCAIINAAMPCVFSNLNGGPAAFSQTAAAGSWIAIMANAGHMAFLDPAPAPGELVVNCPSNADDSLVLPPTVHIMESWLSQQLMAGDASASQQADGAIMSWAASQGSTLKLSIK